MGSLTTYGRNFALTHLFNAAQTRPATVYVGFSTADPTIAATGAACSEAANANNYARKAISFGAAAARRITQDAQVDFNQATGAWGALTHWFVSDSATWGAGNVLAFGALQSTISPVNGNTPRIATAVVYVELAAIANYGLTTYAANAMLNFMFDNVAFTSTASNTFLALLTSVCSDAATTMAGQAETSGTGYARKEVSENGGTSPTWTAAASGAISNVQDIDFATPGGAWTQFVAVAVVDALSGTSANVLAYDNNVQDQPAASGDRVYFPAGDFDISIQ